MAVRDPLRPHVHAHRLSWRSGSATSSRTRLCCARALTHASADAHASNERLEFLGDRVLGLIVAETCTRSIPDDAEGALALKFNALARREACATAAEAAGSGPHIILADSEALSGGRRKQAILGGACEAVIAALYLDGGMDAARRFVDCLLDGGVRGARLRHARPQDRAAGMGAGAQGQRTRRSTRWSDAKAPTMRRVSWSR